MLTLEISTCGLLSAPLRSAAAPTLPMSLKWYVAACVSGWVGGYTRKPMIGMT